MTTETLNPIELFAQLDPLTPEQLEDLAHGATLETFARIAAGCDVPPRTHRVPPRRIVLALTLVLALVVPALASSGVLSSLFSFSNRGTPVSRGALSTVSGFDLSGAKRAGVVELAVRHGVGIYAAKTKHGGRCYFVGPQDRSNLKSQGLGGGCMNAAASARFPSPAEPVVDLSLYALAPGAAGPSIQRLAGVAADGVASLQILALADCRVVASVPVVDNVYVSEDLPPTPEAIIVARSRGGKAVWHLAVTPPTNAKATSCGLG